MQPSYKENCKTSYKESCKTICHGCISESDFIEHKQTIVRVTRSVLEDGEHVIQNDVEIKGSFLM